MNYFIKVIVSNKTHSSLLLKSFIGHSVNFKNGLKVSSNFKNNIFVCNSHKISYL